MIQRSTLYFLIVIVVGSFFTYRIVHKIYETMIDENIAALNQ